MSLAVSVKLKLKVKLKDTIIEKAENITNHLECREVERGSFSKVNWTFVWNWTCRGIDDADRI